MEKTVKKGRNSSIELLRIVCLVMIFWMHAADSGVANGIGAWIDIAFFYASQDMKNWEKTGEFGPEGNHVKGVWECPDLFPIDRKSVV